MDQADPSRSTTCGYNDSSMAASMPSLLLCDFDAIAICTFLSQVDFIYEPVQLVRSTSTLPFFTLTISAKDLIGTESTGQYSICYEVLSCHK